MGKIFKTYLVSYCTYCFNIHYYIILYLICQVKGKNNISSSPLN